MGRGYADVSVILCAYTEDRWEDLVSAVRSVQAQTILPREIIVTIDHNQRLLQRAVQQLGGVLVVENTALPGASGSRNCGVAASQGSVIVFLDDDAEAEPDWLEQLLLAYTDPDVLGVGGMLLPRWVAGRPAWFPEEFCWIVGCSYRGMPEVTVSVRNLIAANMSVRRDVFVDLGGFRGGYGNVKSATDRLLSSSRTGAGDEETELCIRAFQRWPGRKWIYEPRARVHHQVPASRSRWDYFVWRCVQEGLGKGELVRLVGLRDGLASEGTYVIRSLPHGVARGLIHSIRHGQVMGLLQSGAIACGLILTAGGFIRGILRRPQPVGESTVAHEAGLEAF